MVKKSDLEFKWEYIVIAVVVLLWWFSRKTLGNISYLRSDVYLFFAVFIFVLGWLSIETAKYHSPQVVANGCNKSVASKDRPLIIGDWVCFRLGGIEDIPFPANDGVLVVPKTTFQQVGKNYFVTTHVYLLSVCELPDEVERELKRRQWNMKHVYFGVVSESIEVQNPAFVKVLSWYLESERNNSIKSDMLQDKYNVTEGYVGSVERVRDTQDKSILKKLTETPSPDESD